MYQNNMLEECKSEKVMARKVESSEHNNSSMAEQSPVHNYNFGIPPFQMQCTIEQMYALNQNFFSEKLKLESNLIKMNSEYNYKANLERLKTEFREQLLEKKEELFLRRELLTYGISVDSEGYICKEQISSDGKIMGYKRICNKKNLKMKGLICHDKKEILFCILWEGCSDEECIYFKQRSLTADNLTNALAKAGVVIQTARDYKKNLMSLIISHLIEHIAMIEIPQTFGWNLMRDGWRWISNDEKTMKELKKRAV